MSETSTQLGNAPKLESTPPKLGQGGCLSFIGRCCLDKPETREVDALFIGASIFSVTIALLLKKLQPDWHIVLVERLGAVGEQNGFIHAGYCEPTHFPEIVEGSEERANIDELLFSCQSFMVGRQFWSHLVKEGLIKNPEKLIRASPHIAFGAGAEKKRVIQMRYQAMQKEPLFASTEYSEDPEVMKKWAPLIMEGRQPNQPCAMTYSKEGVDLDFGELTKACTEAFIKLGGDLQLLTEVTALKRYRISGRWLVTTEKCDARRVLRFYRAKFVFVGAGGWSLPLLQKAGIPDIKGYSARSVETEWAVCYNPAVVACHQGKICAPGPIGGPPMSMPYIDERNVRGQKMLLFGPWCHWTPRFLKIRTFLTQRRTALSAEHLNEIRKYYPNANPDDWTLVPAAGHMQIVKTRRNSTADFNSLQFGTEIIKNESGDICSAGASSGASMCVQIALEVLMQCYPARFPTWETQIKDMIPFSGTELNDHRVTSGRVYSDTAEKLGLRRDDPSLSWMQFEGYLSGIAKKKQNLENANQSLAQALESKKGANERLAQASGFKKVTSKKEAGVLNVKTLRTSYR